MKEASRDFSQTLLPPNGIAKAETHINGNTLKTRLEYNVESHKKDIYLSNCDKNQKK